MRTVRITTDRLSVPKGTASFKARARRANPNLIRIKLPTNWHLRVLSRLVTDLSWLVPCSFSRAINDPQKWEEVCEANSLQNLGLFDPPLANLEFAARRLLATIVSKYVDDTDESRRDKAIEHMLLAEEQCSKFNSRGYKVLLDSPELPLMREFISRTIGDLLPAYEQLWSAARHGPGAVCGQVALKSTAKYFKYSKWPYSATIHARKYAVEFVRSDPRWLGALEADVRFKNGIAPWRLINWEAFWDYTLTNVPGNRITTVPKDRSKDRPIAIEPSLNMMLQLGVDGFIRSRLKKRWGIDLDDQERNQALARAGSINPGPSSPATIDLSMASDTVSLRIAKLLLPPQWYDYLCAIRSPRGSLPGGKSIRYSKLSSMGNGATFAIESLIFAAVIYAVVKRAGWKWREANISVYGDDLIVPRVLAPDVNHLLRACGFSPNTEKSFYTTIPVRESCGADWYRAYPVRGVYLKTKPSDLMELFQAHNALWLWSHEHDILLADTLAYLRNQIIASGGGTFTGPPDPERTDQYMFDSSATVIRGIAKRMSNKKPKNFLWGKLLASLSSHSDSHPWNPLRDVIGSGSVFTCAGRRDWHYVTYLQLPSRSCREVCDNARESYNYLSRA